MTTTTEPPAAGWQAPTPPPAPRKRRAWLWPVVTGVLGLILGTAAHSGSSTPPTTAEAVTSTVTVQAPPAASQPVASKAPAAAQQTTPAPAAVSFAGDGTYLVPAEVKPGTYRSARPASGMCYWARLKSADGGFGAIIANATGSGQMTVTIRASDKAFQTTGCEDWHRIG